MDVPSVHREASMRPFAKKRIGECLVESGLINASQVTVALCDQQATGLRFGEIIAARGWVSEEMIETLIRQYEEVQDMGEKRINTSKYDPELLASVFDTKKINKLKSPTLAGDLERAEKYLKIAENYHKHRNYHQAILAVRKALTIDENNSDCHRLMGLIYLERQQFTLAKLSIQKALKLKPTDVLSLKLKLRLEALGQSFESSQSPSSSSKPPKSNPIFLSFRAR
jgi:tetratricopeptide (TPR) repeat protein